MKQKDIALIVVIAIVSGVISFVVSGKVFVTSSNKQQKVETVDVINTTFTPPDPKYFNASSIDPAQTIQIGNGTNPNPFNGTTQ